MSQGTFRGKKRQRRKILSFGKKGREDKIIVRQGAGEGISKLGAGAPHKEKEAKASEKISSLYLARGGFFADFLPRFALIRGA